MEEDQEPAEHAGWDSEPGKAFTKPVVNGTTRQAIDHHMAALGMPQTGGYPKAEWKALTKDRMAVARTAHLTHMVAEAKKDGPQRRL